MSSDDLGRAFPFPVIAGRFVTAGLVGIIASGRFDRRMAPRPRPRPDDPAPTRPAPGQEDPS